VFGKAVLTALDTGANSTDLNANFADLFPDAVAAGKKGSSEIPSVGGTQAFASVELPELIFTIGSRPVPLRLAVITMQRNSGAGLHRERWTGSTEAGPGVRAQLVDNDPATALKYQPSLGNCAKAAL
jgi:hypothetical protein